MVGIIRSLVNSVLQLGPINLGSQVGTVSVLPVNFAMTCGNDSDSGYVSSGVTATNIAKRFSCGGSMNGLTVRSLCRDDFQMLHSCWCKAFSDYVVPLNVSDKELEVRLRQDSYCLELSFGAFFRGRMVGFWLSGVREIDDRLVAYDAGTAVIPEYRGQGVSNVLSKYLDSALKQRGFHSYITEAFIKNEPALALYRKKGFVEKRILDAYIVRPYPDITLADTNMYDARRVKLADVEKIHRAYLDYEPSWQNTWYALHEVEGSTESCVVECEGEIVGYGVFQPILRRIAHMGVGDVPSKAEVVAVMLKHFSNTVPKEGKLEIVNIPRDSSSLPSMLKYFGFELFESLYEMERVLG